MDGKTALIRLGVQTFIEQTFYTAAGYLHWNKTTIYYRKGDPVAGVAIKAERRPLAVQEVIDFLDNGKPFPLRDEMDAKQYSEFKRQISAELRANGKVPPKRSRSITGKDIRPIEEAIYDIADVVVKGEIVRKLDQIRADFSHLGSDVEAIKSDISAIKDNQAAIVRMLEKLLDSTNS